MKLSWMSTFAVAATIVAGLAKTAGAKQIKGHEYAAERGGVKLALYEKWAAGEESSWKKNGKVVLLVHGATWSSRCTWDPAPGYSLMDALAEAGYDVWALDFHGYGRSGKPRSDEDWTEAASAAEDIDAAMDYISAFRWVKKVNIVAYQWGTQPAAIFATQHPNKTGKIVFFGLRYNLVDKIAEPQDPFRRNTAGTAMLRPEDGDLERDFVMRRSTFCASTDPQSPNGALRDVARPLPVDPAELKGPAMVVMGANDADPNVLQDRLDFYRALASRDRWFVMLPGLGKFANLEKGRARFDEAVIDFLDNADAAKP